jgi:hypothetical protein
MNKKQHKILLAALKNASSEDVDMFLEVDMVQSHKIMNQARYDNDFDLAAQFARERDASRDFRMYGEVSSTTIDCDNITIKVFSDENYTTEIDPIETSSVSYGKKNVFGKTRGKYILELDRYLFDMVYFQIDSDNISYKRQRWSQRLIYYDADGNFAPYGTNTFDISLDNSVLIENDFPFFFNKHWIKLDYDIIEDKPAKYTWATPKTTLNEGETVDLELRLNKPSPFGNEELTLKWSDTTPFQKYYSGFLGQLDPLEQTTIFEFNAISDALEADDYQELLPYNGNIMVAVVVHPEHNSLYRVGQPFRILEGNYQGNYNILGRIFNPDIISDEWSYYQLILDAPFAGPADPLNGIGYSVGSLLDINVFYNGSQVQLPLALTWEPEEQVKTFSFEAVSDFVIELEEFYKIDGINEVNVEKGVFTSHGFTLLDQTVKKEVRYNLGDIWENRALFTGRTTYTVTDEFDRTASGPSVLRNGNFWEGRNEEFYANDLFRLTITNEGIRTVLPANPLLGISSPSIFEPEESRTFRVTNPYAGSLLHKVEIVYAENTESISLGPSPNLFINGVNILLNNPSYVLSQEDYSYEYMKRRLNNSSTDWYRIHGSRKPFTATFDDDNNKITLTSRSPGVRLVVFTKNPTVEVIYLNTFQFNPQLEKGIILYANSDQNTAAKYRFQISKAGYKEVYIPAQPIQAIEGVVVDSYLVTGYGNILYPYDSELQQCDFKLNANDIPGTSFYVAENLPSQTQNMAYGTVVVNGALLLSSGLLPGNERNITKQGFFIDDSEEEEFLGEFRAAPMDPIPCTAEIISTQGTRAIWELKISAAPNSSSMYEGFRTFDIKLGDGDGAYTLTVGGNSSQLAVMGNAPDWWNNFYVPVADENGEFTPYATLRTRLDLGSDEIQEGPFSGTATGNKLLLVSKFPGLSVQIENIVNFNGLNEGSNAIVSIDTSFSDVFNNILNNEGGSSSTNNGLLGGGGPPSSNMSILSLKARQFAPGIQVGDQNIGRNGLGGFRLNLD